MKSFQADGRGLARTKMLASNATELQVRGPAAGGEVEQLRVLVFPGPASA